MPVKIYNVSDAHSRSAWRIIKNYIHACKNRKFLPRISGGCRMNYFFYILYCKNINIFKLPHDLRRLKYVFTFAIVISQKSNLPRRKIYILLFIRISSIYNTHSHSNKNRGRIHFCPMFRITRHLHQVLTQSGVFSTHSHRDPASDCSA